MEFIRKKIKKACGRRRAGRIASMCLAVLMAAGIMAMPAAVSADSTGSLSDTYVSLGADLSSGERATVLNLLGLTEDDLKSCTVINVTNQEEHQYLDSYLSSSVIGTRAISSVKVVNKDKGNGINVTTQNISYCTDTMYQNALATAGVKDADVVVAGPFNVSGTAGLCHSAAPGLLPAVLSQPCYTQSDQKPETPTSHCESQPRLPPKER